MYSVNSFSTFKSNFFSFSNEKSNINNPHSQKKSPYRFSILKVGAMLTVTTLALAFFGNSVNYFNPTPTAPVGITLKSLEDLTQAKVEQIATECWEKPFITRGGEHQICKLEKYPDLIFKFGRELYVAPDPSDIAYFETEMAKEVMQKEIIAKINKLELTHIIVPRLRTFKYQNYPMIIEEYLESNGVIKPFSFDQEHLFHKEGDKLNIAIEHLTKFLILVKSFNDVNPKNIIVLKQRDNDGNSKLGLIDIDGYEAPYSSSLIGKSSKRNPSEPPSSLINLCTNEQIQIVDWTASKTLGFFKWEWIKFFGDFSKIKSGREQANNVHKELVSFHKSKGIQGFEPLSIQNLTPEEEDVVNEFNRKIKERASHFSHLNYSIPRAREILFFEKGNIKNILTNLKSRGLIFDYEFHGHYIYVQG